MPFVEKESELVYHDPEDQGFTMDNMLESLGDQLSQEVDGLTPNLDGLDFTDLEETAVEFSLEDEVTRRVLQDPEAQMRAIDSMLQEAEEQYIYTQDQLDIARDNLQSFHIEVEEAIANGEKIPDNYMATEQELLKNIEKNQEQLKSIDQKLDHLYGMQKDQAELCKAELLKKNPNKIFDFVTKIIETITKGMADLGNMLHQKNQEFTLGARETMRDVGDKAESIVGKIYVTLQQVYTRFISSMEHGIETIKQIPENIKESAERTADSAKDKANELMAEFRSGVAQVKENVTEKVEAVQVESLADKLERAQERVAKAEKIVGDGQSPVRNALYNLSLDQARKVQSELKELVDSRVDGMNERRMDGAPVNEDVLKNYTTIKILMERPEAAETFKNQMNERSEQIGKMVEDLNNKETKTFSMER